MNAIIQPGRSWRTGWLKLTGRAHFQPTIRISVTEELYEGRATTGSMDTRLSRSRIWMTWNV